MSSLRPSLISGIFASLAAVAGIALATLAKLAFDFSDSSLAHRIALTCSDPCLHTFFLWTLRAVLFGLTLFLNAAMLRFFVKSLAVNGATRATVYNFACNFVLTVLGR